MDSIWGNFETHLINEGITAKRIKKLRGMYNFWIKVSSKPLNKLLRKDIELIITKLNKGEYSKDNDKAYSSATISDMKKFIKQFYKYLKGENNYFPPEVAWISTKIPRDKKSIEKEILTLEQVKELSNKFKKRKYKLIVLLLFDCGFRIEELLSVRVKDLSFEGEAKNKCFWINCPESKTFSRKIPIPLFTKEIDKYLNTDEYLDKKQDEPLLTIHYESFNKLLKSKSIDLFGKKITSHSLRHSSATYYTHKHQLTQHQLCDRYGWAYSSNIPALYIRRAGNNNLDQAKKVFSNEVTDLKEENQELKERLAGLEKSFDFFINEVMKGKGKGTIEKAVEAFAKEKL